MSKPTRLDYCQYLLSTPLNYTLTHFADHCNQFSHDKINRYLAGDRLRPRHVWEAVKPHLEQTPEGNHIVFDDTVVDKRYAKKIALAKKQYSGNARGTINGIGIVTCVYVNPVLDRFWLIDYRIYDLHSDGKTKLDHVEDMLSVLVSSRKSENRKDGVLLLHSSGVLCKQTGFIVEPVIICIRFETTGNELPYYERVYVTGKVYI